MGLRSVTLVDIIKRNAVLFAERTAFVFGQRRISYAEYLRRVERTAAALAAQGMCAGDRIVVISNNNPEFIDLLGAAAWLGVILVPVNWRLSAEEIAFIVGDVSPKMVVADAPHQELLRTLHSKFSAVGRWIEIDATSAPFLALTDCIAAAGSAPEPHGEGGPFVMIHTAAVAGRPRGALISQSGILANAIQTIACWSVTELDVSYAPLPLFHVAGLNLLLSCIYAGAATVVTAKFDAAQGAQLIEAERITLFVEFAPMLVALLNAASDTRQLASLRVVTGLDSPETIARFEAAYPQACFFVGFGQTETSGSVTMAPFRERSGSAGRPMLLSTVSIVDYNDRPVAVGETGEIVVRGPIVFDGYWNATDDTATTFRNGWHHTGDNGAFDADGYLFYKGRNATKELIKPGGENVYPAEVEAALKAHPAILEAVVFGVPDKDWGEAVKAVCALRANAVATPEEISAFVAARIARYKRPKHLLLLHNLPRNGDGAVDRGRVKQDYA